MVSAYSWDNPKPLENEKKDLELLLREVESSEFGPYRTSEKEYRTAIRYIETNYQDISEEDLTKHLETIENYCITRVVDSKDPKERILYLRRMGMTNEILGELAGDRIEAIDEVLDGYLKRKFKK
jgi:hypothetical protein